MRKNIFLFVMGVVLIVIANNMRTAQIHWTETRTATNDTKLRNAGIGAGIGGGLGLVAALAVGGIGIVTGGAGFAIGLPALTLIGAGGGALTGAATGYSETRLITTELSKPAYATWMWIAVMLIGVVLIIYSRLEKKSIPNTSTDSQPPTA